MGWLLAFLTTLFALLLFCRLTFVTDYNCGDLKIRMFILHIFRVTIFPQKEKQEKPEKPKKPMKDKVEAEKKPEKKKKKQSIQSLVNMGFDLITAVPKPLRFLLKGIKISELLLHMAVCGEDAADAAINAGKMNEYTYIGYSAAQNIFTVKAKPDIKILPEFVGEETLIKVNTKASIRPVSLLALLGSVAGGFIIKAIKRRRLSKPKKKNKDIGGADNGK